MIRPTRSLPEDYVAAGHYRDALLGSYLADSAAARPDELCLVDEQFRFSWSEIDAAASASARQLRAHGAGPHDVVTVILPNWWEAVVSMQAVLKLGGVTNPVVPIYRDAEMRFILRQAGSRAVVTPHRFRGFDYVEMFARLAAEMDDPPAFLVVRPEESLPDGFVEFDASGRSGGPLENPASPGDIALLFYTSGTTADPKGVLHTHQTIDFILRTMAEGWGLSAEDGTFMPSPVGHITGYFFAVLVPSLLGAPCVLMDVWDPERARQLIETEKSRFSVGATPFLQGLLDAYATAGGSQSSLAVYCCGGADVPPDLIKSARRELGLWAMRAYGSSEVPVYCTGGPGLDERICAETDGVPVPGAEARLEGASGGVGELLLRAPQMFVGYLDSELNAESFTGDGFFHSGDLGEIGPDGEVVIRGRKKDIIIRGGENVSAKQVEDALYRHPAVGEVAIVAMPDPVMGEKGCAFVVPAAADAPTLPQLTAFLGQEGLAKQKWPERLEIVPELPLTASGKIQKFKLRDRIREILAAEESG